MAAEQASDLHNGWSQLGRSQERLLWQQQTQMLLGALQHTEAAAFFKTLLITGATVQWSTAPVDEDTALRVGPAPDVMSRAGDEEWSEAVKQPVWERPKKTFRAPGQLTGSTSSKTKCKSFWADAFGSPDADDADDGEDGSERGSHSDDAGGDGALSQGLRPAAGGGVSHPTDAGRGCAVKTTSARGHGGKGARTVMGKAPWIAAKNTSEVTVPSLFGAGDSFAAASGAANGVVVHGRQEHARHQSDGACDAVQMQKVQKQVPPELAVEARRLALEQGHGHFTDEQINAAYEMIKGSERDVSPGCSGRANPIGAESPLPADQVTTAALIKESETGCSGRAAPIGAVDSRDEGGVGGFHLRISARCKPRHFCMAGLLFCWCRPNCC